MKRKVGSKEVVKCLQKHHGNQAAAARELGVTRQGIRNRIKHDPIVKSAWQEYVDDLRKKIPNARSIKVISEAMEAETVKAVEDYTKDEDGETFEKKGRKFREITEPDHYARLKANEQFLKITRLLREDEEKKPEQHLHVHLGDKNTNEILGEISNQLAALGVRKLDLPKGDSLPMRDGPGVPSSNP